ncbi:MAG: hypothetical protein ACHRHE_17190 [Tepidisphaerales bacterium]
MTTANDLKAFHWTPQPDARKLLDAIVGDFLARTPDAADLAVRLRHETGTRFFDWIDHVTLPDSPDRQHDLLAAGYLPRPAPAAPRCFEHEQGMFPRVILDAGPLVRVAIKVESVVDFLAVAGMLAAIEGTPLSPLRRARVFAGDSSELWIIERHGYRGFESPDWSATASARVLHHLEQFRLRRRDFAGDADGFAEARRLIAAAIADLGRDYAADLFFSAEREFWQRRNRAGQVQKGRQDRLGMGWANHDHHTYRSSRSHFASLIAFFETLGFHVRERFYASREAGWGAQVLEQPDAGVVIFADVDLAPDELLEDFAHQQLPPRHELGTVGLWCALHGESFLQAGMHHLECQFDFDAVREQLRTRERIQVMKPFTDFSYLRQAFTEGERWPVREDRIARLLESRQLTPEQAGQFRRNGAIGSHLENLERNDGFKGFNQKGVSEIIAATDPRRHQQPTGA